MKKIFLKINNSGFISPIVMAYIFLFISLLSYFVYQEVNYLEITKGYESTVYKEVYELEIFKEIKQNSKRKSCTFSKKYKRGNNQFEIQKYCLKNLGDIKDIKKLELDESKYQLLLNKVKERAGTGKFKIYSCIINYMDNNFQFLVIYEKESIQMIYHI